MVGRVVLAGRPNVGKSTLFNRLTRTRDALVDPTPGLTRDVRTTLVEVDGYGFLLSDTGGLDAGEEGGLEELVSSKAREAIANADLVLLLVDGKAGMTPADGEVVDEMRRGHIPFLLVVNKIDSNRDEPLASEFYALGVDGLVSISAEHGRGLDDLLDRVRVLLEERGFDGLEDEAEGAEEQDPVRVAIIGRPNAGKSSLLNRIVGQPKMVVSDVPGTTRDSIDTVLTLEDGRELIFTDTAGVRRKARVRERVEKFSVIKALESLKRSDIALIVMDASEGITDQDKRLIGYAHEYGKACITVFNKWDLLQGDKKLIRLRMEELRIAKSFIPFAPHLNISALTGRGVSKVVPLVMELFQELCVRINTGQANRMLERAMAQRTPPIHKGHHIKLYYTTQVDVRPPTFVVFANYPKYIPEYYKRFLVNRFRAEMGVNHIPIKLKFKERERRE